MIVQWSSLAKRQLRRIIDYIDADSVQDAGNFAEDVYHALKKLEKNPGHYPPDKNKIYNDGTYRALEVHRYRIIYRIRPSEILILRMRHVKMNPRKY
jgi:plasmid stabilization system protein ParE